MTDTKHDALTVERIEPLALTQDDIEQLTAHIARQALQLSNLTGAAAALLHAVHRAGGYQVFNPHHQEPIHRAFDALAHAVGERLEQVGTQRGVYGLPSVSHPTLID